MFKTLICASAGALALSAAAQDEAPQPEPCSGPEYQQFDFWLGQWQVTAKDGSVAGHNTITKEEGGCLILERWTSASGNTGQSYNFFNPATQKWRQVWVSKGLLVDYEGGLTDEGIMRLDGEVTYTATGQTAPFFGEWTPNSDGTVKQYFQQYNSETETWEEWFTGYYAPFKTQPATETETDSDSL